MVNHERCLVATDGKELIANLNATCRCAANLANFNEGVIRRVGSGDKRRNEFASMRSAAKQAGVRPARPKQGRIFVVLSECSALSVRAAA